MVEYEDFQGVAYAIRDMVIRGAPAIGIAAAYGIAMAALQSPAINRSDLWVDIKEAAQMLQAARPTAVNLTWALDRMLMVASCHSGTTAELKERLILEAGRMADEDVAINQRIAHHGAALIEDGDTIIHHCNTGALASVDWGTALGVIRLAHEQGKHIHVLVDETRPRLQGARLTAWELQQYRIPFEIINDSAAGYFLHTGQVDIVLFGADRVAVNGDVANKIGSYMLALAAFDNQVPVYSVFPTSTVDLLMESGENIPIEERDPGEVLNIEIGGERVTPEGAMGRNPAFDVTPHRLLTGLITEKGIVLPPFNENLPRIVSPVNPAPRT